MQLLEAILLLEQEVQILVVVVEEIGQVHLVEQVDQEL